ncbi:hypothetical protein FA15DRAFT_616764 [Coprinopsis marcescibilis]|uniref:Derlin n=1 Tax=Coprinopsis marcescibilis TaxID=230819 RepID=A0A5C3KZX4_COPMA|nr:hypothetical protein FA15DRAFT_616764 [Coprinopsis marcescibilis]
MSFEHASVTKGFIITSAITSILVGVFDVKHYFHLQFIPHISRHHQYWRLLTHNLAFVNSSDLFLGILILANVGVQIERQFGSLKFASFAFVTLLGATLLEFLVLILFHRVGFNHIALGPALLIFSILYQYSRIVPSVYTYKVFGIPLNSKSLNYFLGLQLAITRFPSSVIVAAIGILAGQIYRSDLAGLKSYRLPPYIVRFSESFLEPIVGSLRPPRRNNRALPDDSSRTGGPSDGSNDEVITTARPSGPETATPGSSIGTNLNPGGSVMREWVNELTGRSETASSGVRAPSEAEISQLTTMFPDLDREVVIGALQRSANAEEAVDTLLLSQR